MNIRICTHCHASKPATLENFYAHRHNSDGLESWCKDCKKSRSKAMSKQQRDPKPRDKGEAFALSAFLNMGIPAELGKNIEGMAWVDIVLWGCLKVEVKYSAQPVTWKWMFYSTLYEKTQMPDVFMLIGKSAKTQSLHYFVVSPSHPMFFNDEGNRQTSLGYSYLNRIGKQGFTIDPLLQHENNFALIEQKRLAHSQQLIAVAKAA